MTVPARKPQEWQQLSIPTGTAAVFDARSLSTNSEGTAAVAYMKGGGASLAAQLAPRPEGTTSPELTREEAAPVVVLPVSPAPQQKFIPLSRREGVVLEIREEEFDARLVDLDGDEQDLEATFAIDELSSDDVPLLRVGAVFYWNIGYYDDAVRRRTRVSEIRLRRLPGGDAKALEDAAQEADQILRELGVE